MPRWDAKQTDEKSSINLLCSASFCKQVQCPWRFAWFCWAFCGWPAVCWPLLNTSIELSANTNSLEATCWASLPSPSVPRTGLKDRRSSWSIPSPVLCSSFLFPCRSSSLPTRPSAPGSVNVSGPKGQFKLQPPTNPTNILAEAAGGTRLVRSCPPSLSRSRFAGCPWTYSTCWTISSLSLLITRR